MWIGANILSQFQKAIGLSAILDPKQCLHNLKQLVYQQTQSLFPPLPKPVEVDKCVLHWPHSSDFVTIQVGSLVTIGCLRAAEASLQVVDGKACEATDAVLDVFRRQYFTEAGRPTKGDQADYFAFNIRYIKKQERSLLAQSGANGIFVEPKTEDAAAPHTDFQVVWLPQLSHAEVKHRAQCEALSIGIARNGRRFGVRVASTHFQQVFQTLKPEALFLAPGPWVTWHCGPWPYGVDRKGLASVFRQWKWDARPLQPVQAVSGGMGRPGHYRPTAGSVWHAAWASRYFSQDQWGCWVVFVSGRSHRTIPDRSALYQ